MVREYIGARYVPKFSDNPYDPTQDYEALTVVDNGMGTSYITKIPTPAGTPLTNTTHWHIYGASSGAIINLQNQIDVINNKMNSVCVDSYGAIGDGVTDDTQAFIDAFSDAKVVSLNANKSYLIKDVTMPVGAWLVGPGEIVFDFEIDTNCIKLSGNNKIIGVKFTDNGSTLYNDPYGIIYGFEVENVEVSNCIFDDIHIGYAIHIDHSNHININHNSITDYSWCGIMCLHTCKYIDIEYNYVYNGRAQIDGNRYPISVSGYRGHNYGASEFVKCNYNYIEDVMPYWEGIDSHGVVNAEFIGNTIKGVCSGIVLTVPSSTSGTLSYNNTNITIRDNCISTNSAPSLGTPVYNRGIIVSGDANNGIDNVIIENNFVTCNDTTPTNTATSSCIGVNANKHVNNVVIKNNKIVGVPDGIGVTSQLSLTSVEVSNNDIEAIGAINPQYAAISFKEVGTTYANIVVKENRMHGLSNTHVSYRGTTISGDGGQLITYKNNDDTNNYGYNNFTTTPHNSLPSATKAVGKIGDFIENEYSSTNAMGWYCRGAGDWLEIAGTPQ